MEEKPVEETIEPVVEPKPIVKKRKYRFIVRKRAKKKPAKKKKKIVIKKAIVKKKKKVKKTKKQPVKKIHKPRTGKNGQKIRGTWTKQERWNYRHAVKKFKQEEADYRQWKIAEEKRRATMYPLREIYTLRDTDTGLFLKEIKHVRHLKSKNGIGYGIPVFNTTLNVKSPGFHSTTFLMMKEKILSLLGYYKRPIFPEVPPSFDSDDYYEWTIRRDDWMDENEQVYMWRKWMLNDFPLNEIPKSWEIVKITYAMNDNITPPIYEVIDFELQEFLTWAKRFKPILDQYEMAAKILMNKLIERDTWKTYKYFFILSKPLTEKGKELKRTNYKFRPNDNYESGGPIAKKWADGIVRTHFSTRINRYFNSWYLSYLLYSRDKIITDPKATLKVIMHGNCIVAVKNRETMKKIIRLFSGQGPLRETIEYKIEIWRMFLKISKPKLFKSIGSTSCELTKSLALTKK